MSGAALRKLLARRRARLLLRLRARPLARSALLWLGAAIDEAAAPGTEREVGRMGEQLAIATRELKDERRAGRR